MPTENLKNELFLTLGVIYSTKRAALTITRQHITFYDVVIGV